VPHILASRALELKLLMLSRSHDCICSISSFKMMIVFVFDVQPCKKLFRVLVVLSAHKHAKQRPAPKWSTMATIFDNGSSHVDIQLLSTSVHVLASAVFPKRTAGHKICEFSSWACSVARIITVLKLSTGLGSRPTSPPRTLISLLSKRPSDRNSHTRPAHLTKCIAPTEA
jgi:hypothetical protein